MSKVKSIIIINLLLFLVGLTTLHAGFDDQLTALTEENIEGYAAPLATSLGLSLNSGMYHTADVADIFGFSIGIKSMTIFVPDDQLTFNPSLPEGYDNSNETSTIYGNEAGYYNGPDGYISFPGGLNSTVVPTIYPQVGLSYMGTEMMLRFIPKIEVSDDIDLFLFGGAIKHNISRYFTAMPVDIALQLGFSKVEISDIMKLNNFAVNAHVSRGFGLFSVYGGLQYENTTMDLTYTFSGDDNIQEEEEIDTTIDGTNSLGITVGGTFKLMFFALNVDYTYNSQSVLTAGMNFEF